MENENASEYQPDCLLEPWLIGSWRRLFRLRHGIIWQVARLRHRVIGRAWERRLGFRDRVIRLRGSGFRVSVHWFPPFIGTSRRMRSSSTEGLPRPSRLEVEK